MIVLAGAFAASGLGLLVACRTEKSETVMGLINLIVLPMWLLSGSFFPVHGVPIWLAWVMHINPLTYGTAALRRVLYTGEASLPPELPGLGLSLLATLAFAAAMILIASLLARRRSDGAKG